MLCAAARTNGPYSANDMPVPVPNLEIDPSIGLIGPEQDRRTATATFPSHHAVLALVAHLMRGASVLHRQRRLLDHREIEHMFYFILETADFAVNPA
jgi:hypothetical protein